MYACLSPLSLYLSCSFVSCVIYVYVQLNLYLLNHVMIWICAYLYYYGFLSEEGDDKLMYSDDIAGYENGVGDDNGMRLSVTSTSSQASKRSSSKVSSSQSPAAGSMSSPLI